MPITLEQVAKLAGVSRSTASRVINGSAGVRPETRERVLKIVQQYDFQPDPAARLLASLRLPKKP